MNFNPYDIVTRTCLFATNKAAFIRPWSFAALIANVNKPCYFLLIRHPARKFHSHRQCIRAVVK